MLKEKNIHGVTDRHYTKYTPFSCSYDLVSSFGSKISFVLLFFPSKRKHIDLENSLK